MVEISIIVPIYNVEKYLVKCLDSIESQVFRNFEVILVNDGSTDNSPNICDEYCEKYDHFQVIHKKNEGLGFARNTGIEKAIGEYVVFIDSDDYVDDNFLSELYNKIKDTNSDTCLGGFKRVDNYGNVKYKERYEEKVYSGRDVYSKLFPKMLGSSPEKSDSIRMSVWNAIYSIDIIKKNNIRFPSEREFISEDIVFDINYYKFSQRVVLINSLAYNYRINSESLTLKYNKSRFEKYKYLCSELAKKLTEFGFDDEAKIRLYRMYFVNVRTCILQEINSVLHPSYKEALKNISDICSDEHLRLIMKIYPVNKLGLKQKIFLNLIEKRMCRLLYLLGTLKLLM